MSVLRTKVFISMKKTFALFLLIVSLLLMIVAFCYLESNNGDEVTGTILLFISLVLMPFFGVVVATEEADKHFEKEKEEGRLLKEKIEKEKEERKLLKEKIAKENEQKILKCNSHFKFNNYSVVPLIEMDDKGSDDICYENIVIKYDVVDNKVYCTLLRNNKNLFCIKKDGDFKNLYVQAKRERIYGILKIEKGGNFQIENYRGKSCGWRIQFFCDMPVTETPFANIKPEPKHEPIKKDEPCYVYLMLNERNGYYKIGISNNPEYREKTLQAEEPEIKKLVAKRYPNRELARQIEAMLHKNFNNKHLRGEWFNLEIGEIALVKTLLV